jgi:hypothetical protein
MRLERSARDVHRGVARDRLHQGVDRGPTIPVHHQCRENPSLAWRRGSRLHPVRRDRQRAYIVQTQPGPNRHESGR